MKLVAFSMMRGSSLLVRGRGDFLLDLTESEQASQCPCLVTLVIVWSNWVSGTWVSSGVETCPICYSRAQGENPEKCSEGCFRGCFGK